jgi:hypothetical protein
MSTKAIVIAVLVGVLGIGVPMAQAGVLPVPIRRHASVLAYSMDRYQVICEGGALAMVMVIGDGDTDLDIVVRDENGNVVCQDLGPTDNCLVRWVPGWTGRFTIEITNLGPVYNNYVLMTN